MQINYSDKNLIVCQIDQNEIKNMRPIGIIQYCNNNLALEGFNMQAYPYRGLASKNGYMFSFACTHELNENDMSRIDDRLISDTKKENLVFVCEKIDWVVELSQLLSDMDYSLVKMYGKYYFIFNEEPLVITRIYEFANISNESKEFLLEHGKILHESYC